MCGQRHVWICQKINKTWWLIVAKGTRNPSNGDFHAIRHSTLQTQKQDTIIEEEGRRRWSYEEKLWQITVYLIM